MLNKSEAIVSALMLRFFDRNVDWIQKENMQCIQRALAVSPVGCGGKAAGRVRGCKADGCRRRLQGGLLRMKTWLASC